MPSNINELKRHLIEIGEQLAREEDSIMNLWTWLPSYHSTNGAHRDHSYEFQPDADAIIDEACEVISSLSPQAGNALKIADEQLTDIYSCACGCGYVDIRYIEKLFGRKALEISVDMEKYSGS